MQEKRTVHAVLGDGREVVRYAQARQWWVEQGSARGIPAEQVSVDAAARLACEEGARWLDARAGGRVFDARVRQLRAAAEEAAGLRRAMLDVIRRRG